MELLKISVYHPNGRDKMIINKEDYDREPGKYRRWDKEVPGSSPVLVPASGGTPAGDLKAKALAFDPNLATEEGILALTDEEVYDNKRTKALADILGLPYGAKEAVDNIRKRNFETVAKLFKP